MGSKYFSEHFPMSREFDRSSQIDILRTRAAGLAHRATFGLGDLAIEPALRSLSGPGGAVQLEPRVMQVFLALADAGGGVLTRDALIAQCWNGLFVGEDAITRAIGEIRKALRRAGSRTVRLETIPKTGYRMVSTAIAVEHTPIPPAAETISDAQAAGQPPIARRAVLIGGAVLVSGGIGLATWRMMQPGPEARRVDALVAAGWDAWRLGLPEADAQGVGFLREAVSLDSRNARAWGMLALLSRNVAELGPPREAMAAVGATQAAVRRALALSPRQGDALAAEAGLLPQFGDWLGAQRRLDAVLAAVPGQVAALAVAERQAREDPLAAVHQHKLIYRLWSAGRIAEMDLAADRALNLWPTHAAIWFARMWTYGYTGRTGAALQLIRDQAARPPMPPAVVTVLEATMAALANGAPDAVAKAVSLNLALALRAPGAAVMAIQHLSQLGALDKAFSVARGYLVREGPEVGRLRHDPDAMVSLNEQHRRKTLMLFIPATKPLRVDPRFADLMTDIGMAAYWRSAGVTPDYRAARK